MPKVTIIDLEGTNTTVDAEYGSNLREVLLENDKSPYVRLTQKLNCGGNGICATCGVWIEVAEPKPKHWHDRLAKQFGYPRLSCQVKVEEDMTVSNPKKIIWGSRKKP